MKKKENHSTAVFFLNFVKGDAHTSINNSSDDAPAVVKL